MGPVERQLQAARIIDLRSDLATVEAAAGLPPGTRVRFTIAAPTATSEPLELTGKIVGIERDGSGYVATVRLNNLSRDLRRGVLDALARRNAPQP